VVGGVMKPALIDTDILSMFLKGNTKVTENFKNYLKAYNNINFSIITHYEILSGLKHKDAHKQLSTFLKFASISNILPLTTQSSENSAIIYADLCKKGTPVDDIDLLIAGIAIENNLIVITNNISHFERIEGLEVHNWSK
jgi:tRNA(fMet)-specific endonuclease VapC